MSNLKDAKRENMRITLNDGVEREIKFTLNAMAEMEDRYGSVDEAFKALDAGSMKAVRFILWAGFIHEDESLTEKQVGNLIDVNCMEAIMKDLEAALTADLPENGDQVPNE